MKEKVKLFLLWFTPLALWFAMLFTGLRIYEHFSIAGIDDKFRLESHGFLYDWPFTARLILLVTLFAFSFSFLSVRLAKIITVTLFLIFLIVGFCLIHYFSVTHVLLSTDLFGYTLNDITTTVSSSESLSVAPIAFFVLYVGLFSAGFVFLGRSAMPAKLCIIMTAVIIIIAALPMAPTYEKFNNETDYSLVENKSRYFFEHTARYIGEESALFSTSSFKTKEQYPFLRRMNAPNALGEFFTKSDSLPNVVFIIVEGLGKDFTGPNADWGGFTPFLDSLSMKSLYWPNALSNTGRTFGALPTILGSLPYGKNGFMSYGTDMPNHQTFLSIAKANGYETHFFYGGNPDFDQQDLFMQYQGVDYSLNETNFPPSYVKEKGNRAYAWGFPDRKVFQASHEILDERPTTPRVDVYLTLSTHEPFVAPEKTFDEQARQLIATQRDSTKRNQLSEFENVFSCLLYTDDAIREFLRSYKRRPEYANTIFIITGDHRLVPVPQRSKLSRFQVPLLIFSPMLKTHKVFQSIVFHSDIFPSLLAYLGSNYDLKYPDRLPVLSTGLRMDTVFSSEAEVGLMRSKGSVQDFVDGNDFLSEGHLFRILPSMDLDPVSDPKNSSSIREKLRKFSWTSRLVCEENRLDSLNRPNPLKLFSFTEDEKKWIEEKDLREYNPEEIFNDARNYALNKEYEKSRIALRYLLNTKPNFHDARVLLSRTFAWNKQYDTARVFLKQVLDRSPYYEDAFNAFSDIAFWKGELNDAKVWAEKGLSYHPTSQDLLARRARGLWADGDLDKAKAITANILKQNPKHELALEIDQKLKQ